MTIRHLVMDTVATSPTEARVMVGCDEQRRHVPYDQDHHTYLTRFATCNACLAIAEATHVTFVAELGLSEADQ